MPLRHTILAVFICLIWGVNFVVAKAAVGYFPTFFFLGIRLLLASLILLPFLKRPELPLFSIFKISVTLAVLHFGLMFSALDLGVDSAVAVVMDQLRVPFAVILGYFLFGESIGKALAFGILLSIIGTFVIAGTPNAMSNYYALWMLVGGSAAWAFYNIQIKNIRNVNMLSFIGWLCLFGAPQLLLLSFIFEQGQWDSLVNASAPAIASVLYMSVFVTIIGHGSWYYLLQKHPVNLVVPYSLLIPVFGVIASVALLNEIITWQLILGAALTIFGVAIIVTKNQVVVKE